MSTKDLILLCRKLASEMGVDQDLAVAICGQESNYNSSVVRYEANWSYLCDVEKFSKLLGISFQSEFQLQKFSWGPMQVMGSVARELGYYGHLTELITPQNGLYYGVRKLSVLSMKYSNQLDVIASYNGGSPSKVGGEYRNKNYVDSVKKRLERLKLVQ
jgi:soluble lytic murein transglycosylase-like protein